MRNTLYLLLVVFSNVYLCAQNDQVKEEPSSHVKIDSTHLELRLQKVLLKQNIGKGNSTINNANYKIDRAKKEAQDNFEKGKITRAEYESKLAQIERLTQKVKALQVVLDKGKEYTK